jgi:hypothetical protein
MVRPFVKVAEAAERAPVAENVPPVDKFCVNVQRPAIVVLTLFVKILPKEVGELEGALPVDQPKEGI